MRYLIFFLLLTFTLQAQTYENVFSGRVADGDSTYNTYEFSLVNTSGTNLFDTLHLLIQAGDSLASAGIVYYQTKVLGRWSQAIPVDTLTATAGTPQLSYPLDQNPVTVYLADTMKNKWFLSTGIGSTGKTRINAKNTWRFRVFVVGTTGNPTAGGYFRVDKYVW